MSKKKKSHAWIGSLRSLERFGLPQSSPVRAMAAAAVASHLKVKEAVRDLHYSKVAEACRHWDFAL